MKMNIGSKNKFLFSIVGGVMATFLLTSAVYAKTENVVSEESVRVVGRAMIINSAVEMNWPMSGIEFRFTGTEAEVFIENCRKTVYLNASVDGSDECYRFAVDSEGWVKIADNLAEGTHTVKLTRSSEACDGPGIISVSEVRTDGDSISATEARERKMEFIGDSYTVGYGNLEYGKDSNSKTPFNTDSWRSYAGYTSRALEADANIIAFSGKGVAMNTVSNTASAVSTKNVMPIQYEYANPFVTGATTKKWDFQTYVPQVVVLFLGTNDYGGTIPRGGNPQFFYERYCDFLDTISSKYPSAHIICCSKPSGSYGEYVKKAVEDSQNSKYHFVTLESFKASGVHSHPYYTEDIEIANELTQKINELDAQYNIWQADTENGLISRADKSKKKISVKGNVGISKTGDSITLMIIDQDADVKNLARSDIKYLDETLIDANGKYEFLFPFNGEIDKCKLLVNRNGIPENSTIKAVRSVYEGISVDLKLRTNLTLADGQPFEAIENIPTSEKAYLNMENIFGEKIEAYTVMMAFYDENGKLINVGEFRNESSDSSYVNDTIACDIPAGAVYSKAFIWSTVDEMVPVCENEIINFMK